MITQKNTGSIAERLGIQEKALSNLADTQKKRETEMEEKIHDMLMELKALKIFLSRALPEFKKEFPEIQRKLE